MTPAELSALVSSLFLFLVVAALAGIVGPHLPAILDALKGE